MNNCDHRQQENQTLQRVPGPPGWLFLLVVLVIVLLATCEPLILTYLWIKHLL